MATIVKRGSLQWQVKIRRKGYPVSTTTFNTKKEAEQWAVTTESEMGRGDFQDRREAEDTTLHQALERYEKEITPDKKGKEIEEWRIRSWKSDALAKRSLASLRSSDFAKWRDDRLKTVKPATCRNDLALISHLFTIAVKEWGIAVQNPIKSIRLPVVNNARERIFDGDEEDRLITALESSGAGLRSNIWMKPLMLIAIETAMRQSELLKIEWSDVNLDTCVIRLHETKNGTKRDVPLSTRAVRILSELPRGQGGKVFPTTSSAVKQAFSRACARAQIIDFHFHDLRHVATSRLAVKLQLNELMKVTGHKDTRMLSRYYHPRAEDLAKKLG
jgi:integrase